MDFFSATLDLFSSLWSPNEGFPGGGKSRNTINVPPKARRRRRRRPARRRRSPARSLFSGLLGVPNWQHPGSAGSSRRIRGAPGPADPCPVPAPRCLGWATQWH